MSSFKRATKDTMYYLPGRAVAAAAGLLSIFLLNHYFEIDDYGRFDLTSRFVLFLYTLSAMWLSTIIVRYYPSFEKQGRLDVYGAVVTFIRAGGLLAGLVVLLVVYRFGPDRFFGSYRSLLIHAVFMYLAMCLFETGLFMLRAKGLAKAFAISQASSAVFRVVLGLALGISLGYGVKGVIWGYAAVPLLFYWLVMHRYFSRLRWAWSHEHAAFARELLVFGIPLGMTSLLTFFLGNLDRYLLKYLTMDDGQVGMFAVGNMFAEQPIQVLFSSMMLAVFPAASRIYDHEGREATEEFVHAITRLFLIIAVPACVGLSVLAKPIFLALIHNEGRLAYDVVPWVASAALMLGLSQYATLGMLMAKRTVFLFVGTGLAVAANLAVNWFLIPQWGYPACGCAKLVGNGALVLLLAAASHRHLTWRFPIVSCVRVVLAALAMAVPLHVLVTKIPDDIAAVKGLALVGCLSCAGSVMYGTVLLLLGELSKDELAALWRRAKRLMNKGD